LGGNIQREYGEGIFPGNISGEYKVYIPSEYILGIWRGNIGRVYLSIQKRTLCEKRY
jgi:hypothetical protein